MIFKRKFIFNHFLNVFRKHEKYFFRDVNNQNIDIFQHQTKHGKQIILKFFFQFFLSDKVLQHIKRWKDY